MIKELIELHRGREVMYSFFYRSFINSPDEGFYEMIENLLPSFNAMAANSISKEFKDGVNGIDCFMKERSSLSGATLQEFDLDMQRFYTRLFCLSDSVPMTESWYTSVERLTMQDARDAVLKIYSENGMRKSTEHNENEDFISVECSFMSFISMCVSSELEKGNADVALKLANVQKEFLMSHLMLWVPEFLKKLTEFEVSAKLYLPIGQMLCGFIAEDIEFLSLS